MRSLGWLCGVLLLGGTARAEDRKPAAVNLLVSVPTTIAVSSTVENAQIVPAHLVDGSPRTAWNSRTGELTGAWIAVRVPADTRVTSIKMTAGFTHVDPRLGDLFVQNPRIKKVRVSRAGTTLGELALDPESRALQELAVNAPGGDFRITVIEIVPGTRQAWRETCVSELEVWGTLAAGVAPRPHTPAVRIASLDAPPATPGDACVKAVFPAAHGRRISAAKDAGTITAAEEIGLSPEIAICRIAHQRPGAQDLTVEIAAVKRQPRTVIARQSIDLRPVLDLHDGTVERGSVEITPFPLTSRETAVLVTVTYHRSGSKMDVGIRRATLYRVTATDLAEVLSFESSWSHDPRIVSARCALRAVTPAATLPAQLVLDCDTTMQSVHDEDAAKHGMNTTPLVTTYRWNGTRYEQRSP